MTVPPSFTDLANLRHAYSHLAAGRVKDQKQFADGLIAPVIRSLEQSLGNAQAEPEPAAWRYRYANGPGEYSPWYISKKPVACDSDMQVEPLYSGIAYTSREPREKEITRLATIEECAAICDKNAEWAEKRIESNPSSSASEIFATISNACNDCAEMIRDLRGPVVSSTQGEGK